MRRVVHWSTFAAWAFTGSAAQATPLEPHTKECAPDHQGRCFIGVTVMAPDAQHVKCYTRADFERHHAPLGSKRFVWIIEHQPQDHARYKFVDDENEAIRLLDDPQHQHYKHPGHDDLAKTRFHLDIPGAPATSKYGVNVERIAAPGATPEACQWNDPVIAND